MENGRAPGEKPATSSSAASTVYDEKAKQKAERQAEKAKQKDVNFWQQHKQELYEMLPFLWPSERPSSSYAWCSPSSSCSAPSSATSPLPSR